MTGRLHGKRIIITGAVGNIGKEALRAFVAEGARVVLGDRDEVTGAAVAAEFGGAVRFVAVDVTSEDSVAGLVDAGTDWLGGLDVLAQNAGLQHSGAVADFDGEALAAEVVLALRLRRVGSWLVLGAGAGPRAVRAYPGRAWRQVMVASARWSMAR